MEPQNTFIVRFWWRLRDPGDPLSMGWYGRIQHLQSGEGVSFGEARQLLAFIERYVTSFEVQRTENLQGNESQRSSTSPPGESG